jgi:hypothetical protein
MNVGDKVIIISDTTAWGKSKSAEFLADWFRQFRKNPATITELREDEGVVCIKYKGNDYPYWYMEEDCVPFTKNELMFLKWREDGNE